MGKFLRYIFFVYFKQLIEVNKYLLRIITGAHSMIPIEFIYLETASLSIDMIVRKRRLMYLHHILHSPENELLAKFIRHIMNVLCQVTGSFKFVITGKF